MTENVNAETAEDFGRDDKAVSARWLQEIKVADRDRQDWVKKARKVLKRYRDERAELDFRKETKFNILWSNTEILQSTLYARSPKSEVVRRFKDRDPVGRVAAQIGERALDYAMGTYEFDEMMKSCVQDVLLPGMGQAWVRYIPSFEEFQPPPQMVLPGLDGFVRMDGAPVSPEEAQQVQRGPEGELFIHAEPMEVVASERVEADYVHWEDFFFSPARTWEEVRWVGRRAHMTRKQLKDRFKGKGENVRLTHNPHDKDNESEIENEMFSRGVVYEIWDKDSLKVYWVSPGYQEGLLDEEDDPLQLQGFFPCPRPIFATQTTGTLIPIPDYVMYQDQARELDIITTRIHLLISALKVTGVYNAEIGDSLQRALKEPDNSLIPVDQWAMMAQSGGVKGNVEFLPVTDVANALKNLYEARDRTKQDIFEVTGISDLIRGASKASESATAQSIKAQFGSMRLRRRQAEIQRFARDILRIKMEIIVEQFSPESIMAMAGVPEMGQEEQQLAPQALMMLKDDAARSFHIDVETDSTIEVNETEERQNRVEFIQSATNLLEKTIQIVQVAPSVAPVVSELLLFGIRTFKSGRQLEDTFEGFSDGLQQQVQQQQQAQQQQAQAQQQQAQQQAQMQQQQAQAQMQTEAQMNQARLQMDAQKIQGELAIKQQASQGNLAIKANEAQARAAQQAINQIQ